MIDTLHYANKLKAVGIPSEAAEVQAETLAEFIEDASQYLATKADMNLVEERLKTNKIELEGRIENLRSEMTTNIENLRCEMNTKFATVDTRFANVDTHFANMKTKIAEIKSELIKWVVGIGLGQAALIISLLKFWH